MSKLSAEIQATLNEDFSFNQPVRLCAKMLSMSSNCGVQYVTVLLIMRVSQVSCDKFTIGLLF